MLQVVLPVALVFGTVSMRVSTVAMSLIIDPLAFVLVSMYVPEGSLTVGLIKAPVTFVASTILPDLNASSMSILTFPLTEVLRSILKYKLGPVFDLSVVILPGLKFHVEGTTRGDAPLAHRISTF